MLRSSLAHVVCRSKARKTLHAYMYKKSNTKSYVNNKNYNNKNLFVNATERVVTPRITQKALLPTGTSVCFAFRCTTTFYETLTALQRCLIVHSS